nr:protein NRT1/ PTR FAMILY 2.7-like [Ipomoea batatas]
MDRSIQPMDYEAAAAGPPSPGRRKLGGWITFPFIQATMAGLTLAAGGVVNNLIVYLIQEFSMKSISAAKVYNAVNGCITILPILGAIIADSFLGCFSVIWISSLISLLATVLIVLTASIDSLRPAECDGSSGCIKPTTVQYAVLYAGLALMCIGVAGTRFTIATMGADQFDTPKQRQVSFNWYVFTLYTSSVIATTAIVFVEDNVSWAWGFGICVAFNVVGLAVFLSGKRFYRRVMAQGSPFIGLARVLVAALRKTGEPVLSEGAVYYHDPQVEAIKMATPTPTQFFKFLNCAALITEGDANLDGSIAKPWRLCTVQQVEDLKSLFKLFPLWASGLCLSTPLVIQASLAVLQALKMDRQMGPHIKIPSGSVVVFILISTSITITFIDRVLYPLMAKYTTRSLTPLQRIGVGHALILLSMAISALVEARRLKVADSNNLQVQSNGGVVPMSVFWLVPPLALAGVGEAFTFPGNVAFYYQEFPESLKSTSTAVVAMFIGICYYLGNAVMDLLQRVTAWLPDNINNGRVDNVFWACSVLVAANFGYYMVCACMYKYKDTDGKQNEGNE